MKPKETEAIAPQSPSEIYAAALDEVTDAMNQVCGEVGENNDAFVAAASRRLLANTEW